MHDLGSTVCTQASLCGCTRPEIANRLIYYIQLCMYCIASSQTAKRRVVQPVHSLCWQEDTQMHGLLGTDCTKASSFGCISPEGLSCCLGVRGALPVPSIGTRRNQSIALLLLLLLLLSLSAHVQHTRQALGSAPNEALFKKTHTHTHTHTQVY